MNLQNGRQHAPLGFFKGGAGRTGREAAAYRRLALQLTTELREDRPSVLIVSCDGGEVAAQTSVVLACHAAEECPGPVLLVDANIRDRELTRMLGSSADVGYSELVADSKLSIQNAVTPTSLPGLSFLPAGATRQAERNVDARRGVRGLLEELEQAYSLVILAGGSMVTSAAGAATTPYVGCVLLAVIEDKTRTTDLEEAQRALSVSGPRKAGLIAATRIRGVDPLLGAGPRTD